VILPLVYVVGLLLLISESS